MGIPPFSPFPPTNSTAEALTNNSLMFAHITVLIFLILLILYCYKKIIHVLPLIVVYFLSLVIGMISIEHIHTPISPIFEIFFMLFQTSIFIVGAIEYTEFRRKK